MSRIFAISTQSAFYSLARILSEEFRHSTRQLAPQGQLAARVG